MRITRFLAWHRLFPIAAVTGVALVVGVGTAGPAAGSVSDGSQVRPVEPGSPLWVSRYQGPGGDNVATAVAVSPGGSTVFVTGASEGPAGLGHFDYATVAYDVSTGAQLWVSRYDGMADGQDLANSIAVSPDGHTVFVTGQSEGAGSGNDYATVAYDASTGAQLWVTRYNGPGNGDDHAQSVAVSPGGATVFVTGGSAGAGSGNDYATVAYDAVTGAQLWVRRYNGPAGGNDFALSMAVAGHRVFVTGHSGGRGPNTDDYATVAYSSVTGARLWVRRYNGPADRKDSAHSIAAGTGGRVVYVTGASRGIGTSVDYATIAYSAATGRQLWLRRYNGPANSNDSAHSVAVGHGGHEVFVTGFSNGGARSGQDYATIAYNAVTGARLWVRRYNGPANRDDFGLSVAPGPGGADVFVTGFSTGAGYDYATVAYNAVTGARLWTRRYDGQGQNNLGCCVAVGAAGMVFVTGASGSPTGGYDYATIAYKG